MNTVRDNIESHKCATLITSGSFGEGLHIRGSDLDMMQVKINVQVFENLNMNAGGLSIYFEIDIEDTHPGFTKLRLVPK